MRNSSYATAVPLALDGTLVDPDAAVPSGAAAGAQW
jgi:hypothetical protein